MTAPISILIVDDDPLMVQTTRRALASQGYTLLEAGSAAEALQVARQQRPDLVLLDVVLPDMDGVQVCQQIKADPRLDGVHVILLSAKKTDAESQIVGLDAGADGYIVRPITARELRARVQAIVRLKAAEDALRESEAQYRLLAETTRDIILLHDMEGRIAYVNQAGLDFAGFSEAEALSKPITAFLPPDRLAEMAERRARRITGDDATFLYETEFVDRTGRRVPVEVNSTPVLREGRPAQILIVARDITERKRADEKIRESEETYRNLFQNAQVGLFRTRISDGKILESNAQLARMFGYDSREAFIAEYVTSQNYVDPGTRERMLRELQEKGSVQNFQARFYRRDGSIFWAEYSAKIYPEKGWIEGVAEDITARQEAEAALREALEQTAQSRRALLSVIEDQKAAEQTLRENNRRLSTLNHLGLALAQTFDLPTIYRIAYEHIAQLVDCPCFGISRYDPATQTLRAEYMLDEGELLDAARFPPLTLPPDTPLKGRARAILAQQPEIVSAMPAPPSAGVLVVGASDDEHIPRSALYVPIVVHGQTYGLLELQSYHNDAYGEAEAALLGPAANQIGLAIENARLFATLEAERTLLRTLVDHLPIAVYVKDAAGRKTLSNPVDVRNIGADSEADVLGKTDFELFPPDLAASYHADDMTVIEEGQPVLNREEMITRPGGGRGWQSTSKVPVRNSAGEIVGLVGIGYDITERRQAALVLQQYAQQLEAMVAERTRALQEAQERLLRQTRLATLGQIAGSIAHELRTPLGAIKNAAYLINMLHGPSDETLQEAIAILNQEVANADRIITSLLTFARPQQAHRQLLEVGPLLERAARHLQPPPNVQIELRIAGDLPPVIADATHLQQALSNLFLNALQAMPEGGRLTVGAEHCAALPKIEPPGFPPAPAADGEAGWIVVSVGDTGVGIPPENLERIFEPLFTTKTTGIGLGLALVKLLIQANGGGLAVASLPGEGTTFDIYLPVAGMSDENINNQSTDSTDETD
ncbi:MAG: PAS domain S-box protein [Anaerolineae bacterium]|mgnify:CR=1 FL=1